MLTMIVAAGTFFLGTALGAASIIRQARSGRLVAEGRVYFCKDTGPVA